MVSNYDEIIQRCQSALRVNYDREHFSQAKFCFDAERALIEERGFSNVLVEAAEFGIRQQQHGRACRVYGAGCGSMINYLLNFSEVDPIRHRTLFQRFWITSDGSVPIFSFRITSPTQGIRWTTKADTLGGERLEAPGPVDGWEDMIALPGSKSLGHKVEGGSLYYGECVTVSPMTPAEQISILVEHKFPQINIPPTDSETFEAITTGDTEGVFQFESAFVRKLATEIRPKRIDDLAVITALYSIECSHPEVVAEYLSQSKRFVATDRDDQNSGTAINSEMPLFQEAILSILHDEVGLNWPDAWRFILDAKKNKLDEQHPLWSKAVQKVSRQCQNHSEAANCIRKLVNASQTASCRAHHIANAITSYRTAFLRTHHRAAFESALDTVASRNIQHA